MCQMCGGKLNVLGILGSLKWLRCEACGMQYSRTVKRDKWGNKLQGQRKDK